MDWSEEVATREYKWVRLASQLKFDGYGDYMAGVRFPESLAGWLAQFKLEDRQTAYDFVKNRLVYFSSAEVNRLVTEFQPRYVEPILRAAAGEAASVPPYMANAHPKARAELERLRRRTLYIGLSDGARIDILRRANAGILANDQIVLATHIDGEKWKDLQKNLSTALEKLGGVAGKFDNIFLIDDFAASGTTFIRKGDDGWTGKLYKFFKLISNAREEFKLKGDEFPLSEDVVVFVHHYISTTRAHDTIVERIGEIEKDNVPGWFKNVKVTEGLLLPPDIAIDHANDPGIWKLTEDYYDHDIFVKLKPHLPKSQTDLKRGYADCALPVILDHNCPNNSITLLWAETEGSNGVHAMRPLFPRRHRHS